MIVYIDRPCQILLIIANRSRPFYLRKVSINESSLCVPNFAEVVQGKRNGFPVC